MVYVARDRELTNLVYAARRSPARYREAAGRQRPSTDSNAPSPTAKPGRRTTGTSALQGRRRLRARPRLHPRARRRTRSASPLLQVQPLTLPRRREGEQPARPSPGRTTPRRTWPTTCGLTGEPVSNRRRRATASRCRQTRSFATLLDDQLVDQATYTRVGPHLPRGHALLAGPGHRRGGHRPPVVPDVVRPQVAALPRP